MRRYAKVEPGPPGQQSRGEIERDAVDEVAQHQSAAHVPVGDERQGCEEVLAELAVGGPGLRWRGNLEAEAVDEDRAAGVELDVVGAGVLESHPRVKGPRLQLEGEERGLLQLGEGPLVRVGDEPDRARADDGHGVGPRGQVEGDVLVLDDQPSTDEPLVQPGCVKGLPVGGGALDLPVQDPSRRKTNRTDPETMPIHHLPSAIGGGVLAALDGLAAVIAADAVEAVGDQATEEEWDGKRAGQDHLEQHAAGARIDIRQNGMGGSPRLVLAGC